MSLQQAYLFYIFLLTGLLIGIIFDFFRILRKSFNHSNFITIIQDLIFFIITSILVIFVLFKYNNGVVRSYVIIGIFCGLLIYFGLFSKIFVKINVKIIEFIKSVFSFLLKIVLYPFKLIHILLKKTLLKPISFIFINIKKSFKNIFYNKFVIRFKKINIVKKGKKSTN